MDFQAAADLVAALRPFVRPTRSPQLEGFERLVRTASNLTGEIQEIRRIMPARAVRSRAADPSSPVRLSVEQGEVPDPRDPDGAPVSGLDGLGESAPSHRGLAASPGLILLLLLLILMSDAR